MTPQSAQKPLVVIGSSSAEMFDYVFGDHPDYHSVWASGWSARGLRREGPETYLGRIHHTLPRRANVILMFGIVDCYFVARYLKGVFGFVNMAGVARKAARGILRAQRLLHLPQRHILAAFSPVIGPMPKAYWARFSDEPQLDPATLARGYQSLASRVARHMPTLELMTPFAAPGSPEKYLAPAYQRAGLNHHADYVKMQDLLWDQIKDIPGMLPRRDPPHSVLYEHNDITIGALKATGRIRPRTCR